jgi:L,D-peptidoglycan transpeptidase YkuD (ErfK/YbiS/YcfS/YnhG family)
VSRGSIALAVMLAAAGCRRPSRAPIDSALVESSPGSDPHDEPSVRVPDETRDLVLVVTPDWTATTAVVSHWRRRAGGWIAVDAPWRAVLGYAGSGWGRGLHGDGAPVGYAGPSKREGDGRSPAGMFAIGPSFGYADAAPVGMRGHYTAVTATWRCIDDPHSHYYGQIVDQVGVSADWSSAEDLRRDDELYRRVVEIRHNPDHSPDRGSCIFLHVWSGPDSTTIGCTAMALPDLERLMSSLDPAARPVLVLLPAAALRTLAPVWNVPVPSDRSLVPVLN